MKIQTRAPCYIKFRAFRHNNRAKYIIRILGIPFNRAVYCTRFNTNYVLRQCLKQNRRLDSVGYEIKRSGDTHRLRCTYRRHHGLDKYIYRIFTGYLYILKTGTRLSIHIKREPGRCRAVTEAHGTNDNTTLIAIIYLKRIHR